MIPETGIHARTQANRARADTPYEIAIADDFRRMFAMLQTIEAPEKHHWTIGAGDPLRWFSRSIAESTRFSASVFLKRLITDDYDTQQLHIEVRIGWDDVGQIGTGPLPTIRRAILWCELGPRINFTSRSLIDRRDQFQRANPIEELFQQVKSTLDPALSALRRDR